MIQPFVRSWVRNEAKVKAKFAAAHPSGYDEIVETVVQMLHDDPELGDYPRPDPRRIEVIDHGDYQGTRLFIIGETGESPTHYWSANVSYGSCSYCDTFDGIREYDSDSDAPSEREVQGYLTLALHILQWLSEIKKEEVDSEKKDDLGIIPPFAAAWTKYDKNLRASFAEDMPSSYMDIVRAIVFALQDDDDEYSCSWRLPDPSRIVEIDHGKEKGVKMFIIGANGYQPSQYWAIKVDYGMDAKTDPLEWLLSQPTRVEGLMTLALYMLRGASELGA